MDENLLKKELIRDEGFIRNPYYDTEGYLTVGIGFNLSAHTLPQGITFPLSDEEVDTLYQITLKDIKKGMDNYLPWWKSLDEVRQRVVANMVFNMGIKGVLTFKNTLAYIQSGNYVKAAENMRQSKWYRQVKRRAERLCIAMEIGVMPNA